MKRLKALRDKKIWKRGASELIAFAITSTMLVAFLAYLLGAIISSSASQEMDLAVQQISREVVVCDSMAKADRLAKELAEDKLEGKHNLKNVKAYVNWTNPNISRWEKGVLITITIEAEMTSNYGFSSGMTRTYVNVMIENGGKT